MNVYGSFIHNCQIQEAKNMTFSGWVDKQTVVYPYNGMLINAKDKWAVKSEKYMGDSQMNTAE